MSIELLKDGRYRVRLYADGTKSGRRIQETLPWGTTKQEAEAYYRRKLADAAGRRGSIAPGFWSLGGLIDEYLRTQEYRFSEGTRIAYRTCSQALRDGLGGTRIDRLKPSDVQRYQKARLEQGMSPHTVNRELALLKAALNYAVAQNWLDRTPLPRGSAKKLRVPQNRTRFFSIEEWQAFIGEHSGDAFERLGYRARRRIPHLVPFWWTLVLTGMRVGEALALEWRDIDLDQARITLTQRKTGAVKHVPISSALRSVIEGLERGTPGALVFTDFDGKPLTMGAVHDTFIHIRALAALPADLVIHSLRHTFASWLASSGVPLHTIGKLLGHTGPGMTARYAHLSDGALVDAVEVVSRIVSGEQSPPIRHHGATVSAFHLK